MWNRVCPRPDIEVEDFALALRRDGSRVRLAPAPPLAIGFVDHAPWHQAAAQARCRELSAASSSVKVARAPQTTRRVGPSSGSVVSAASARPGPRSVARSIRVGVIDEHEIFRRGVVACLLEDPLVSIVANQGDGALAVEADVVVASQKAVTRGGFGCPVVMCADRERGSSELGRVMAAVLPRSTLTPDQLIASVRSAAVGLTVSPAEGASPPPPRFEARRIEVLRLLAEGADTHEISTALRYSERTVKSIIHDVESELGARTRAQAVASAIREGLITI